MAIPRIYHPTNIIINTELTLSKEASHHLINVLRLSAKSTVLIFNGIDPGEFQATLISANKNAVAVFIQQFIATHRESPLHTHLGQCISKNDRMDFTIQKASECGVTEITPLFSERCEVRLTGERLEKKIAHWKNIAISAAEQSGRCKPPTINTPLKYNEWINSIKSDLKLMCDTKANDWQKNENNPRSVSLFIGPEGGLTDDEIHFANQHGFQAISLGPRILRTETAGVVALSLIQHLYGDMS